MKVRPELPRQQSAEKKVRVAFNNAFGFVGTTPPRWRKRSRVGNCREPEQFPPGLQGVTASSSHTRLQLTASQAVVSCTLLEIGFIQ